MIMKLTIAFGIFCLAGLVGSTHHLAAPTTDDLIKAANMGMNLIEKLERQELNIMHSRHKVHNGSISHGLLLESYPTLLSVRENLIANMILKTTEYLENNNCKKHGIGAKECGKYVMGHDIPNGTLLKELCQSQLTNTSSDRQINSYRRLLPSEYHDGIHKFRKSITGGELPNPRHITSALYNSNQFNTKEDSKLTIAVPQWTQFIEQDLARTVQSTMRNGHPIQCCDDHHRVVTPRSLHPFCHPLHIPHNDVFYSSHDATCLNYVRSGIAVNSHCQLGPIEQINQATSLFDLSQLYGVTATEQQQLRKFTKGKMRSVKGKWLPITDKPEKFCSYVNMTRKCSSSGDSRVNSNPYSSALHTVFLRHHNALATELHKLNPDWDDDALFNVARKLNVMLYQRIIYEEWAPIVIGQKKVKEIMKTPEVVSEGKENKQTSNEFATAAIRFYNTMFPENLILRQVPERYEKIMSATKAGALELELFKLQDVQYTLPKKVNPDTVMTAATRNKAMKVDLSYVDDLSNHFYHSILSSFGSDALALDIQRSRDHGISSYLNYLQTFIDPRVSSWDELVKYIHDEDVNILRQIYKSVQDVDLIVGALAEKPVKDAAVGPTLQFIIAEQLSNSRDNDENFYVKHLERSAQTGREETGNFAPALLCDTTSMAFVQKNIFLIPSADNQMLDCKEHNLFPKMKLRFDNLLN